MNALILIFDYLTRRKQRVKINLSICLDLFQSVPQRQILRLNYSIYFSVISYFLCLISQWFLFAEEADNTPYVCSESADVTPEKLEKAEK